MTTLTYEDILACEGHTLAIDCETNGLSWYKNEIIGIGIHCPQVEVSGYVHCCSYQEMPYGKPKKSKTWNGEMDYSASKRGKRIYTETTTQTTVSTAIPDKIRADHFLKAVHRIVQNPKTIIIGHNLKFDAHFLGLKLWQLPCKILDTAIMVHLVDSRLKKSLAASEDYFLGTDSKRFHVSRADKKFAKTIWNWGSEVLEDYCTNDCVVTYQLAETLMSKIKEMELSDLLKMQMKYLRLLQRIERRGIKIENTFCYSAIEEFNNNLIMMEKDLYDAVGYEFNWRSNPELSKAIYDNLGIPKPKDPFKDEYGNVIRYSAQSKIYTASATGTPLLVKHEHPLRSVIMDLRETYKLKEYAESYLELQDSKGVIHGSFNATGAITGRLSGSGPNLQQLASKYRKYDIESLYTGGSERVGGYNLRCALCAREGYTVVSIDHKQQEVRLLGILANEPTILQYMKDRKDVHMQIALAVWGDVDPATNKKHRDWSKATVFGLSYGMSEESLQEHYAKHGIEADAGEVTYQFFSTFPGLEPWFEQIREQTLEDGYTRYWSGRYWFLEEEGEEYKAVNAQIQGGAGDFLATVLIRANEILEKQKWGEIISIIHDECLYEIKNEYMNIAPLVLARCMEGEWVFGIPFITDIEYGPSYGALEPYVTDIDISTINWKDYT